MSKWLFVLPNLIDNANIMIFHKIHADRYLEMLKLQDTADDVPRRPFEGDGWKHLKLCITVKTLYYYFVFPYISTTVTWYGVIQMHLN